MAPMQTASEWLARLDKRYEDEDSVNPLLSKDDGVVCFLTIADVEARDREVRLDERIKTLREAARLVCPNCDDSPETLFNDERGWGHTLSEQQWEGPCDASELHDRITELEAERGKEGEVT